ncbi:ABC transporter permease [Pseudoalteromonas luteoviolacea]|uniref:ABC transporter permease n=1 Tax=Pseudoalteromonas luteoviolacea TaxID=43657 RepID=UPI001B368B99|nr:ABC transporter permease [Pseudoalteromonas luteoviolacea]MBQ4837940.1 ABC transporter permease [Pseudoalteromonas luteoviolacea]
MITYYTKLAFLSLWKTRYMSLLAVIVIAVGISATMTTYTINHMMTKDPLPSKSDSVFLVRLNNWSPEAAYRNRNEENPPIYMSVQDAVNLINHDKAQAHIPIAGFKDMLKLPEQSAVDAKMTFVRSSTTDFFSSFEVPFLYGSSWPKSSDDSGEQVVVISKKLNAELFDGQNSVGRVVQLGEHQYTVVGVLNDWFILPRFYGESMRAFKAPRDIFIPFQTQLNLELWSSNVQAFECWKDPENASVKALWASECVWVFFWVQLNSDLEKQEYMDFLQSYVEQQKALGRFQRPTLNKLQSPTEYLKERRAFSTDSEIAVWLSICFFALCLLNAMSIIMTKFQGKAGEVALRRAVGASSVDLVHQYTIETGAIGLFGGILGLVLTQVCLFLSSQLYTHLSKDIMTMSAELMVSTVLLSILSSLVFGMFPIIKAINVQPATQLKSL